MHKDVIYMLLTTYIVRYVFVWRFIFVWEYSIIMLRSTKWWGQRSLIVDESMYVREKSISALADVDVGALKGARCLSTLSIWLTINIFF